MAPTIFISSTYEDLIPYRQNIWEVLTDLNLKIKGMEKFGARKTCPLDTCIEEVQKSDIYIGIIAYRFGSIEPITEKSFTQLEYEKALSLNRNILIYLMADDGNIQPRFVDFGFKAQKLDEFKNTLKTNHTVDFFKDPSELKLKIYEKLIEVYPTLKRKYYTLNEYNCKLFRLKIGDQKWIIFIGYYSDIPISIFAGLEDEEIFPIPKSITHGKVIKSIEDGENIIWFQYTDKYGYKKSIGALQHKFDRQISSYCSIITKLLQEELPLNKIYEIINEMDLINIKKAHEWKEGVIKALKNNN
jgi:hypothetical protein